MNKILSLINTFLGSGITSTLVAYIVQYFDPTIGALIWTFPFTLIIPIYFYKKSGKTNEFISKYLYTQTYTLPILLIFLLSFSYFMSKSKDDMFVPLFKSFIVWLIVCIVFFIISKKLK